MAKLSWLILLLFLSSAAPVAAKHEVIEYAQATGKLTERANCWSGGIVGRWCLPFVAPSEHPFRYGTTPFRYYLRWPPVPTRADQLILEARARLMDQMSQKPPRELPWWPFVVIAFPGVLFTGLTWRLSRAK